MTETPKRRGRPSGPPKPPKEPKPPGRPPSTTPPPAGTGRKPEGAGANWPIDRVSVNIVDDDRERLFVAFYVETLAGGESARLAGYKDPRQTASRLLRRPSIRAMIDAAHAKVERRCEVKAADVVARLWDIATADTRDIITHKRGACRHCHGIGHRYQFTAGEMERAEAEHALSASMGEALGAFDEKGGPGFDERREPSPECPECFGKGRGYVVIADTERMSDQAALLLAGIKQGKDGIEVKLHSQVDALVNVGRHLGVFNDKLNLNAEVTVNPLQELFEFLRTGPGRIRPRTVEPITDAVEVKPQRIAPTGPSRLLKTATQATPKPAAKKAATKTTTRKKT